MNEEFLAKLKATFEDFDTRLRALEHSVNDVIIGSLESAATEYKDAEDFGNFKTAYGEKLAGLIDPYKKLFGEDYDLERTLFDDLRGTEGYGSEEFDEAGVMDARIADLQSRIDALKGEAKPEEVEKVEEEVDEAEADKAEDEKEEEISDEQLAKELKDAMDAGASD